MRTRGATAFVFVAVLLTALFNTMAHDASAASVAIYWTDNIDDKILRSDLDGSNVTDLVTAGLVNPSGIAVTGNSIFWSDSGTGAKQIGRSDLDGSNAASVVSMLTFPTNVEIRNSFIYWPDPFDGDIKRANLDGTGVTSLITGLTNPFSVSVTASFIYWTDPFDDIIRRANLDGSNATDLISSGLLAPGAIHVTGDFIYWEDSGPGAAGKIQRSGLDGSNVTDLITSGLPFVTDIFVTDDTIYWSDISTKSIQSSNLLGGNVSNVVTGLSSPSALAVVIPEPSGAILLIVAGMISLLRTRRLK